MAPNSMSDTVVGPATVNGKRKGKPLVGPADPVIGSREMFALIRDLVRPYTGWLIIVLVAMLMETAMSLAAPWPLKVVIDSVLGAHPMPDWMSLRARIPENPTRRRRLALIVGKRR
jgi:hypothetical protein